MKNLAKTFVLVSLVALLGSCSSASLTVPNKPAASNDKSDSKSEKSKALTFAEQHKRNRELFIGANR